MDNPQEMKLAVARQFKLRAPTYESYTVWNSDQRVIDEILLPLCSLRPDAVCLDLGGGSGTVAAVGEAIAGKWIVCDISSEMLAQSRNRRRVVGDADSLPFRSGSLDLVVARSILSYVSLERLLREARRTLNSDGFLVIAEKVLGDYAGPAAEWYRRVQEVRNPLKSSPTTTNELSALVESCGFEATATVELRRVYRLRFTDWLSRGGTISAGEQRTLIDLIEHAPDEVKALGLAIVDGYLEMPISWAIIHGRVTSERPHPGIVVSIVPVRLVEGDIRVYVQKRRAPILREPEYLEFLEFPQGHLEGSETVGEAARRELAEEAGLIVRAVLNSRDFSDVRSSGHVAVEGAAPDQVVLTRGRLNHLAMMFIVEADEGGQSRGIDNKGRWMGRKEFNEIVRTGDIYPLNLTMFQFVVEQLDRIEQRLRKRQIEMQ